MSAFASEALHLILCCKFASSMLIGNRIVFLPQPINYCVPTAAWLCVIHGMFHCNKRLSYVCSFCHCQSPFLTFQWSDTQAHGRLLQKRLGFFRCFRCLRFSAQVRVPYPRTLRFTTVNYRIPFRLRWNTVPYLQRHRLHNICQVLLFCAFSFSFTQALVLPVIQ